MSQLSLDTVEPIRNELEEKYRAWLHDHQGVFALFERFALEMLEKKRRFGIGALTERVRWQIASTWEKDGEGYKINNNWRAYIARDLIRKYPELTQYITLRTVRTDEQSTHTEGSYHAEV